VSKKLDLLKPEFILTELPILLTISEYLKCKSEMLLMLCLGTEIKKGVIDDHNDKPIPIRTENPVHQIHEHGWGISQTERHDKKLERPVTSQESGRGVITILNPKLTIARSMINLRKPLRSL
jgi:hypothetical protein